MMQFQSLAESGLWVKDNNLIIQLHLQWKVWAKLEGEFKMFEYFSSPRIVLWFLTASVSPPQKWEIMLAHFG